MNTDTGNAGSAVPGSQPDSRARLAAAYHDLGDAQRAIPLYERVLADPQRVLGDDHPATMASFHNLAGAYDEAGDVRRAVHAGSWEPMYQMSAGVTTTAVPQHRADGRGTRSSSEALPVQRKTGIGPPVRE